MTAWSTCYHLVVPAASRPLRSDAARNRQSLLRAAEVEFADRGGRATMADVARRADVAKGTVFRHFASKEDLIAALVSDHLHALTAVARGLLASMDPGAALLQFLTVAADERRQHDLTFLQTVTGSDSTVGEIRAELYAVIESLVDRARAAGALRQDITGTDVILLMCAPVHVVEYLPDPEPDLWRRYLGIIFDGLRPGGATPLPHGAPARI